MQELSLCPDCHAKSDRQPVQARWTTEDAMSDLLQSAGFVPNDDYTQQLPVYTRGRTYILDFTFPSAKLCVEVDGAHHRAQRQRQHDALRDLRLEAAGWKTLRFTPDVIHRQPDRVIEAIREVLTVRLTSVVSYE